MLIYLFVQRYAIVAKKVPRLTLLEFVTVFSEIIALNAYFFQTRKGGSAYFGVGTFLYILPPLSDTISGECLFQGARLFRKIRYCGRVDQYCTIRSPIINRSCDWISTWLPRTLTGNEWFCTSTVFNRTKAIDSLSRKHTITWPFDCQTMYCINKTYWVKFHNANSCVCFIENNASIYNCLSLDYCRCLLRLVYPSCLLGRKSGDTPIV